MIPYKQTSREELLLLLKEKALQKGYYILSSGKHSTTLLDCKRALLSSRGHFLVGSVIFDEINKLRHNYSAIDVVAAVPIGGCSIASAVSMHSSYYSGLQPVDAIYVRKEAKTHGNNSLIDGDVAKPSNITLVEDIITTGGSSIKALTTLKDSGYNVVAVICVVDRLEGGKEAIEKQFGIPVVSLFTMKDFE